MAEDVRLGIALEITPTSLRAIQTDINNAMRQLNPHLNIDIREIEQFAKEGLNLQVNLSPIQGSVANLQKSIENVLDIKINKLGISAKARKQAEREAKEAFDELQAIINPNFGRASRATPSLLPPRPTTGTFGSASDLIPASADDIKKAQEKFEAAFLRLAEVTEQESNARHKLAILAGEEAQRAAASAKAAGLKSANIAAQEKENLRKAIKEEADARHELAIQAGREAQNAAKSARAAGIKDANIFTQAKADLIKSQQAEADARHNLAIQIGKEAQSAAKSAILAGIKASNIQLEQQEKIKKEQQKEIQARQKLVETIQQQIREGKLRGPGGSSPLKGPGGNISLEQLTNPSSLKTVARNLDFESLNRFIRILNRVPPALKQATGFQEGYNLALARSNSLFEAGRNIFARGIKSVTEFGVQTAIAAKRLLAWSLPATFIFGTISALKNAVNTLKDLDTQARRLVFFKSGGLDSKPISNFGEQTKEVASNIQFFIDTSRRFGTSINETVQTIITASKVGQQLTKTIKQLDGTTRQVQSAFLDTVLSLVRLEGGALSAEDAVTSLNAIQIQFFQNLKSELSSINLDALTTVFDQSIVNTGALLAVVSADAAFSLSELADATSRVGAAFANIQGTSLPQVIALIGEASSATGANVGRLSTALRQILTFSVQNAEQIKTGFGIDVIDSTGAIKGFGTILDILTEISQLRGTEKAIELSRLIGDRRNVGDIQALAAAVGNLRSKFGDLSDARIRAKLVGEAVLKVEEQNILTADSLQSAVNQLSISFTELVSTTNVQDFFKTTLSAITETINSVRDLINEMGRLKDLLIEPEANSPRVNRLTAEGRPSFLGGVAAPDRFPADKDKAFFSGDTGGGPLGDFLEMIRDLDKINELKKEGLRLDAIRKSLLAEKAENEISIAQEKKQQEVTEGRIRAQAKINELNRQLIDVVQQLNRSGQSDFQTNLLKTRALAIQQERTQLIGDLSKDELDTAKKKVFLLEKQNELRRQEESAVQKIEQLEKALSVFAESRKRIEIEFEFDKVKTQRELDFLAQEIDELIKTQKLSIEAGAGVDEAQKIEEEINKKKFEQAKKIVELESSKLGAQEKLLNLSSKNAQEQIDAWKEASNAVANSFRQAAASQVDAANFFFAQGEQFSDTLANRFKEVRELLEEAGASVAEKFSAVRDFTTKRLEAVQRGANAALASIASGPIKPFGSTSELRSSAQELIDVIVEANGRANDKVLNEETKLLDARLANLRTEKENSQIVFDARIAQTKAEIDIRKRLASEELSILRERLEAERQLNKERIDKQREFGRLIIEGPKEFLAVANDIKNARQFFKGIGDLSVRSLQQLSGRAGRAQQTNQFAGLQSVLKGLEAAQKFGRPDIISGVSNSQLQQVFERIQITAPEEIFKDLKRQQQELQNQTEIQKQIEIREAQNAALLEAEAALQNAQLRLDIVGQSTAIKQRDAMLKLMNDSITQQRKDFDALIKLQAAVAAFKEIEFFGQQEEDPNIREAKAALQTILEGLRKREADARSAPPVEPTSLGNSLNEAVSAVGLFNGKLLEISEIQEKFARGLSGPVATPGVINRASSTVGGIGGAEAISKIEELIRRTSSGGIGIGRSKEFQSLEKVIKETGGTAAQRSRLEELKRTEVSPRSFGAGQETDAARTLLRDREISGGLEQGFRGLLQGNTGLVEQLREARGTGARGARAIDPERVREILGRGGLSGLARDVDTKGEATQLVDKLLKFSDELSKTPDRLSERAVNILREILATELKEGFKEVAQVLQAQRNPISEEEKKAADARGTRVDIFNENSAVDFANKFNAALKEQFDERAQVFAEVLNGAIRASLQNNNIKVDIPSLDIELRTTVTNVLAGDAFLNALEEKLTGIFGRDEDFTKLRDKIKEIATVMVSTGQIQPE